MSDPGSNNVVPFCRKDGDEPDGSKMLWVCACGCTSFQLRGDGTAQCAKCETTPNVLEGAWYEWLPQVPHAAPKVPDQSEKIVRFNTSEAALQHVIDRATPDNAAYVMVLHRSGSVSIWGDDIESEKDRAWFDARTAEAAQLRTVKKVDG